MFLDFDKSGTDSPANQPMLPRVLLGDFRYSTYDRPDSIDALSFIQDLYNAIKWG